MAVTVVFIYIMYYSELLPLPPHQVLIEDGYSGYSNLLLLNKNQKVGYIFVVSICPLNGIYCPYNFNIFINCFNIVLG